MNITENKMIELINSIDMIELIKPKLEELLVELLFDNETIKSIITNRFNEVINSRALEPALLEAIQSYVLSDNDYINDIIYGTNIDEAIKSMIASLINSKLGIK